MPPPGLGGNRALRLHPVPPRTLTTNESTISLTELGDAGELASCTSESLAACGLALPSLRLGADDDAEADADDEARCLCSLKVVFLDFVSDELVDVDFGDGGRTAVSSGGGT